MKVVRFFKNLNVFSLIFAYLCCWILWSFIPTRQGFLVYFNNSGQLLEFFETLAIVLNIIIHSIFYGILNDFILDYIKNKQVSLAKTLKEFNQWGIRSFIAVILGWGGFFLISIIANFISYELEYRIFISLFGIIWIVLTFILYPVLVLCKKSFIYAIYESFLLSIKTIHKWGHLLIFLFLVSGGITFIWLPIIDGFTRESQNYFGWSVHFQWLGGYSFNLYWVSDLLERLFIPNSLITKVLCVLVSIIISISVKFKILEILSKDISILGEE